MELSITGGLKNMFGGAVNFATSPLKLLTGDIGGAFNGLVGGPLQAAGGTLQTALGAVTLPIRLPLSLLGSVFGRGGSPQAQAGGQAAMSGYPMG